VFHTENMHGSPLRKKETVRFSFDLRVASQCLDDNAHYRYNFWNLNNFQSKQLIRFPLAHEYDSIDDVSEHFKRNKENANAQFYSMAMKHFPHKDKTFFKSIDEIFDQFPFAEDRYFELSKRVSAWNPDLSLTILEKIIDNTESYFWALKCSNKFFECSDWKLAQKAFDKTILLAETTNVSFESNPVPYEDPCTQILPKEAIEISKEKLSAINNK